ncbi:serine-rich adhesin for platelets isoform X2 [Eupeodes corollae]|uniref:serine-rich adhesin for platelets isoform X2 n=1 Tax=Eupeodes corollae TaxID=290404 RepID=UPI0024906EF2|nr:serine-rich adhesin for platelets isoform X2 [Eupeodes corollae]
MNNCEITGGSNSSSSDIEQHENQTTTIALSEANTALTLEDSINSTTSTTTTGELFYTSNTNNNNNNKSNENLEIDTKCAGKTSDETPAAATAVTSIVAASSLVPRTLAATTTTVSYAAITAMDTASATALVCAQTQKQTEANPLPPPPSSECDKNSTIICDKNLTKLQETKPVIDSVLAAVAIASAAEKPSDLKCLEVLSGEGNKDNSNINQNQNQNHHDDEGVKETQEVSVLSSSPALLASPLLLIEKENKEEGKSPVAVSISTMSPPPPSTASSLVNTLSGSKSGINNCFDIVTTTTAAVTTKASPTLSVQVGVAVTDKNSILLQAQNKIDNNHLLHHHHHHPHPHPLTTTASAPILMQSTDFSRSDSTTTKLSTVLGTTTSMGLNAGAMITRRVSFPKSDEALVTGYLEPANPWEHVCMVKSISEIAELYVQSCNKHNTTPIPSVLEHLKLIELDKSIRQPCLLLKNIKLMPADCEALEEIFKRVQYKSIDVSSCDLNEAAASALFDMFEYYEVTNELDISSNADGMTPRGWTSCIYMVSHSRALQVLNAQGNPLSKNCADSLGSALNSSNLHTIKLEHCGLRGHPLDSLCTKLRNNQILKELWLAYNDLTCTDADKIAQLLRTNHFLQLIDISNNNIKDEGLMKIVKALIEQSTELERQKIAAAAIAYALAEAEHKKRQQLANSGNTNSGNKSGTNTNNSTTTTSSQTTLTTSGSNGMGTSTDDEMTSGDSDASPAEEDDDDDDDDDDEADDADVDTDANDAEDDDATTTEDDGGGSRVEDDDDDEDTVKTSTVKTTPPMNGQSKLDKLLSMNNSDSSEEAPTDTVAASDISVSDDIFDSTNVAPPPLLVSSTPIAEPTLDQPASNNNNNTAAAVLFEVHELIDDTGLAKGAIPTKALDVNKNSTKVDDFDDTHSTDSAFESSSDGDISRHLPDEFVDRFDGKDEVETATIATEALTTPTPTPTPPPPPLSTSMEMAPPPPPPQITQTTTPKPIEVAPLRQMAASVSPNTSCESSSGGDISALKNAALTGTSPSPAPGMRRTESTCTITQSTRVRSHSSDSLSSDNSLDGSISDNASGNFSTRINEKLTKNDTLTRQKQFDVPVDNSKTPHGLKALALWNNNLTKEAGPLISDLLATTVSLELLNIGKNILSNDFVAAIRDSLSKNTTLTTLGLQSAHLSCAGIRTLSSILQFGGNSTLHRIDIRDNKIEVESLNMLAEALKSNTTVTQIDIDDEPKRLSIGSDAQLDYARVLENVRSLCARNENQPLAAAALATDKSAAAVLAGKRHGGYYLGSRKISLTCHSAPPRSAIVDQATSSSASSSSTATTTTNTTPTSSKLEVKKKTGVRLRSPIPSPPTISPSSSPVPSPSKSRFQVFRVSEVSPLTSPMTPSPSPSPTPSPTPLSTASGVIINSKDSTTTIKRLSTSPRSRFQVMKIYEDPGVPIAHRTLPPITPSPSPPTAPSITRPAPLTPPSSLSNSTTSESTTTAATTTTSTVSSPSWTFEEQKIITTPATPPIQDIAIAEPSFNHDISAASAAPIPTPTATTTTTLITNNSATNTKSNPNSIDVNNSTNNTVKPNDQVDASASVDSSTPPVQIPSSYHQEDEESTKCQTHLCPPPLPVVEDDQRTLTNSPDVNIVDSIGITATSCSSAQSELKITTETVAVSETETESTLQSSNDPQAVSNLSQDLQSQPAATSAASPASGRTRKNSWIPNSTYPGTVDRLLSMFQNPTHLFHRSSSPDTTIPISQEDRGTPPPPLPPSEEDLQQSLVPVRRRTPPAGNQFPWCKLGTEMCKPVTTVMQSAAAVSSGYVACGPPTTAVVASVESPRSFFDAASKQLRDFSKQVFRQNIAFGNEATNVNQEQQQQLQLQLTQQQMLQHDCDTIPSDMKLEIKENISPEHTINEEQLHSLQKIGGSPGSSSTCSSGTETTEGASIPSSSSSPSSLLSVPLIGIPPTIPPSSPSSTESTVVAVEVASKAIATTTSGGSTIPITTPPSPPPPTSSSQPQKHVLNEEQSCNS